MEVKFSQKHQRIIDKIAMAFSKNQIILVGGSVRDILLGYEPKDIDFATNASPEKIISIVEHIADKNKNNKPIIWKMGIKYGTIGAKIDGETVEFTTFRNESYSSKSRRPEVEWEKNFIKDSARRDFTINSMGYDIIKGELLDYWGGVLGIKTKNISMVGVASKRINEDPLRMLRAVRFASQLEFNIDEETKNSILANAQLVNSLSADRKREELTKIIMGKNPDEGIRQLVKLGLMKYIIPEVNDMIDMEQPTQYHDKDVFNHTMSVLKNIEAEPRLRWAALLHDIGKPHTFTLTNGQIHYYGHQDEGAQIAYKILKRLAFSNEDIAAICHLVRQHMFAHRLTKGLSKEGVDVTTISDRKDENTINFKTAEKFVNQLDYWKNFNGEDRLLVSAEDVMKLNKADILGGAPKKIKYGLRKFEITKAMVEFVRDARLNPRPKLPVNGNDLKKKFSLEEGKDLGDVLQYLTKQLEDGNISEGQPDQAYSAAQKYLVEQKHYPLIISPLTGDEIIKSFNITQSKELGVVLKTLKNLVAAGELNAWDKEKALTIVQDILG